MTWQGASNSAQGAGRAFQTQDCEPVNLGDAGQEPPSSQVERARLLLTTAGPHRGAGGGGGKALSAGLVPPRTAERLRTEPEDSTTWMTGTAADSVLPRL